MGLGFLVILLILGGMRELVGQGTLFTNMQLLFGPMAAHWQLNVIDNYGGFLLAIFAPGAFLGLGLIIAGKNVIDKRLKAIQKAKASDEPKVSRRVRTTGKVS